ncbi:MAG: diguanylate cyclase, partial [Nitrospiria bacterium]
MNGPIDLDLREIENREWQLWFMAITLIMVLSGIIIATYFFILGQSYEELSYVRSMAYRGLGGLFVLTALFCIYVSRTHFTFRMMRALLVDMSRMMASPEDLNVLLATFACRIARASAVTVCQIALLTRSGIGLKIRSIHAGRKVNWKPQIGKAYPLGRVPACRQVIESLQPVVLHQRDIPHMKDDDESRELLTGGLKNLRSVLILPMVTKGRVMGILILGRTRGFKRNRFTTPRIVLAQALARQVATAIDHVRLIEGMQKTSISLLEATLDSTADGILVVDRSGKIVSFNLQFAGMWRIPQAVLQTRENDAVLGYVMHQLNEPEQFLHKIKDLNARPEAQSYDTIECKDGRIFESFSQPQLVDGEAVGRVWSFRDVTERKRAEETLAEQAIRDSLTNLYNRRYFNQRMEEESARADRNQDILAILLCDLDQFKAINDTRGHHAG